MITFVNSKMKSNNILVAMILMIKNCNVSCLIMIFTLEHIIKQIERKSSNTNIIYYLNKKKQRVNVMMWFTIFFVMCATLSLMAMLSKVEGINYVSMILVRMTIKQWREL